VHFKMGVDLKKRVDELSSQYKIKKLWCLLPNTTFKHSAKNILFLRV
jgi:hypothetical protein